MEILLLKKLLSGIWGGRKSMRGMGARERAVFLCKIGMDLLRMYLHKKTLSPADPRKKYLKTFKNLF